MNDNWQPIETAPKDGSQILLYGRVDSDRAFRHIGFWSERWNDWLDMTMSFSVPTHWMPLPAPPESEER